jgi:hypothetical protein
MTGLEDRNIRLAFVLVTAMLSVCLAAFVVGCHSLAHPKDLRSVSVTLKRTACYGTCPVYSVAIHGNGLVEHLGELNVDIPVLRPVGSHLMN